MDQVKAANAEEEDVFCPGCARHVPRSEMSLSDGTSPWLCQACQDERDESDQT